MLVTQTPFTEAGVTFMAPNGQTILPPVRALDI